MITIVNGPKGKALITQDSKGRYVIDLHSYVSFAFLLPLLADNLESAKAKAEQFCKVGK
jgi:bacteriorhodopsin